jgi:ATP-binding cassette subfamily G (WHITE) protein 2 (SNQ2)
MDVHEVTATVREALRFSAYLRQPYHISKEEKVEYVEEVIDLLELHDLANAIVASLGLETRKRSTIGVELASKPEVLFFLDEPTFGLDAQSAWNIVRFLHKLANNGQAILCTIHQPSAFLFESFDRLLLRGGETVRRLSCNHGILLKRSQIYFGDVGEDAEVVREYLARYGAHCPPNANPAEYMLEAIGAGLSRRIGDRDWAEIWNESPKHQEVLSEILRIKTTALVKPVDENTKKSRYSTPRVYQLKVVSRRAIIALWRNPGYVYTRLFFHAIVRRVDFSLSIDDQIQTCP